MRNNLRRQQTGTEESAKVRVDLEELKKMSLHPVASKRVKPKLKIFIH